MDKYTLEVTIIEHEGERYVSVADISKFIKLMMNDPSLMKTILPDVPPPPPPPPK